MVVRRDPSRTWDDQEKLKYTGCQEVYGLNQWRKELSPLFRNMKLDGQIDRISNPITLAPTAQANRIDIVFFR